MKKKSPSIVQFILLIIIGVALLKQFDSSTLSFHKPWLSLLYGLTIAFLLFMIFRPKNES